MRATVVVETMLAAGLVAWALYGDARGGLFFGAAAAAAGITVLTPLRAAVENRWRRALFVLRRSRRGPSRPPVIVDVDTPGDATPTARIGIGASGDRLFTMLRVHPTAGAITRLGHRAAADERAGHVTAAAVAECLRTFDVPVESVDLIMAGRRATGPEHVARTYHEILGPLPALATLTTFAVIRLRPADGARAIARRGGGRVGAARAAAVTTARIAAALRDTGLSVTVLDAARIRDAATSLADGTSLDELRESWSHLDHGAARTRVVALDTLDSAVAATASSWTPSTLSTTLTLSLRADPGRVAGLLRITERAAGDPDVPVQASGVTALPGRQFEALCATLPVGAPAALWHGLRSTPIRAAGSPLPVGGCGQLIGADAAGRAVFVDLAGVDCAVAAGTPPMIRQLLLRAVATGAAVRITTSRPEHWLPLVAAIGDPGLLDVGSAPTPADRSPLYVVDRNSVHDNRFDTDARGHDRARVSRLVVFDDPDPAWTHPADVRVIQDPRAPEFIDLEATGHRLRVAIVGTGPEGRLIGERRTAPGAARAPASLNRRPVPPPARVPGRTSPSTLRPAR